MTGKSISWRRVALIVAAALLGGTMAVAGAVGLQQENGNIKDVSISWTSTTGMGWEQEDIWTKCLCFDYENGKRVTYVPHRARLGPVQLKWQQKITIGP